MHLAGDQHLGTVMQHGIDDWDDAGYTLRIKGHTFRPKVFRTGSYTVRVGDQDQRMQAFPGIQAAPEGESKELPVKFD